MPWLRSTRTKAIIALTLGHRHQRLGHGAWLASDDAKDTIADAVKKAGRDTIVDTVKKSGFAP